MKLLLVLASITALCAGGAFPTIPGDNSHYVEGESRYIWMPDGEGVPHLVDLHEPADDETLQTRRGADNAYWLFTRLNPTNAHVLIDGDIRTVINSNYDGNRPLKVIAHGWTSDGHTSMNPLLTSAFLATQDANVIIVDWSGAAGQLYSNAVRDVPSVGQFLGNFLVWLIDNAGGNWGQVHLIGMSLGAHVVGNAGRTTGGRVSRVTGLDPAGPQWIGNPNALNRNDGIYVESIHTDGGVLGIFYPISDADFYVRGGRHPQPGCLTSLCSHARAFELFELTIRADNTIGRQCSDISDVVNPNLCTGPTLNMGNGDLNKRGSGIYYVPV